MLVLPADGGRSAVTRSGWCRGDSTWGQGLGASPSTRRWRGSLRANPPCGPREFDVSAERVFDAWLNPDLIGRWMLGPALRAESVLRIALEPRAGGCTLELAHELRPEWAEYADRTRDGWTKMLGCLAGILAGPRS